jgi:Tfp pilus assembly PilM family ATPase
VSETRALSSIAAPRPGLGTLLRCITPRYSAIVFDLGATGWRACQLRRRGATVETFENLRLDLPPESIPRGEAPDPSASVEDPAARLAARAARLMEQARFRGRDVGLVLSPRDVQFHALAVPPGLLSQSPQRVQEALRFELSHIARSDPAKLEIRYWSLPDAAAARHNVMAVTMDRSLAQAWVRRMEEQGLHLRRLDVAPLAQARLGSHLFPSSESDLWGVLDAGYHQATLTILVGSTPTYIRSMPTSLCTWTARLAQALDIAPTLAEQLHYHHGISAGAVAPVEPIQGQLEDQADLGPLFFSLLREQLTQLADEIVRCLSYVLQAHPETNATRVLLAGSGGALPGLAEFLELHVGLPVAVLRAPDAPRLPGGPDLSAALGGALLDLETT